jgi:hypothetical protein
VKFFNFYEKTKKLIFLKNDYFILFLKFLNLATLDFYLFLCSFYFLVFILLRVFSSLGGKMTILVVWRTLSKLKVWRRHCELGGSLKGLCRLFTKFLFGEIIKKPPELKNDFRIAH